MIVTVKTETGLCDYLNEMLINGHQVTQDELLARFGDEIVEECQRKRFFILNGGNEDDIQITDNGIMNTSMYANFEKENDI